MKSLSFEGLEVGSKEYQQVANRRFYNRHKEEEKARSAKYLKDNPEYQKNWAKNNPEKRRAAGRKFEYNLLPEQFEAKMVEQERRCPLCSCVLDNPDVDHDHFCCPNRKTCGKCTRGLLCHGCNTALGLFGESEEVLQRAIDYLRKWKGTNATLSR